MYQKSCYIYIKELFGKLIVLYYMIPIIISFVLGGTLSYIILFAMILFQSYQAARMYKEIDIVNSGYYFYRKHKGKHILIASLIPNVIWLICLEVAALFREDKGIKFVIFIFLLWIYMTVIGNFIGTYVKNEVFGYALILLLLISFLSKFIIHEEYFRYISPMLLVINSHVNPFNAIGIAILSVIGFLSIVQHRKKIKRYLFITMIAMFLVLAASEIYFSLKTEQKEPIHLAYAGITVDYNNRLGDEYAVRIASMLLRSNEVLESYGFHIPADSIEIKYSIYFPWESSSEKIFFKREDNRHYLNCFTDSLRELSNQEIIMRYVNSIIKTDAPLQRAILLLLVEDVSSQVTTGANSPELVQYSWKHLIETYGSCVLPKYCAVAECMIKDPANLFHLFVEFGTIDELKELDIDSLPMGEDYKAVLKKIIN